MFGISAQGTSSGCHPSHVPYDSTTLSPTTGSLFRNRNRRIYIKKLIIVFHHGCGVCFGVPTSVYIIQGNLHSILLYVQNFLPSFIEYVEEGEEQEEHSSPTDTSQFFLYE